MEAVVRRGPLLAALVVVALGSVACGPGGAGEPVVLRVIMADDWASAPAVRDVIDEFERQRADGDQRVRVQIQGAPFSQIPDLVRSAIELGQSHDLAHWHAFAAAAAGLAEPLDERWSAAGLTAEEYLPGAVEDVTWDGRRYGVPLDTNALVLMINGERFEAAGLELDDVTTVEGFERAAEQVVASDASDFAITVTTSSWAAYGWIVASGGSLVTQDAAGDPVFTIDDPANVAALERLAALVDEDLSPGPFSQDLAIEAIESFADGTTAMHASGSWDLPIARRAAGDDFQAEDVEIVPIPQADPAQPRTVLGGSSLFVPIGAPEPDLAFELMLALTQDDVALRLALEEGRLPARVRVFDDEVFAASDDLVAFVAQLPTAEVMPLIAYPEVAAAFREGLEDAVAGRESVDVALGKVQAYAQDWQATNGQSP
jgi:multiple sugar transport system substrate-binding protein